MYIIVVEKKYSIENVDCTDTEIIAVTDKLRDAIEYMRSYPGSTIKKVNNVPPCDKLEKYKLVSMYNEVYYKPFEIKRDPITSKIQSITATVDGDDSLESYKQNKQIYDDFNKIETVNDDYLIHALEIDLVDVFNRNPDQHIVIDGYMGTTVSLYGGSVNVVYLRTQLIVPDSSAMYHLVDYHANGVYNNIMHFLPVFMKDCITRQIDDLMKNETDADEYFKPYRNLLIDKIDEFESTKCVLFSIHTDYTLEDFVDVYGDETYNRKFGKLDKLMCME